MKKRAGFTLLEMLVVIVIIVLLTASAVALYGVMRGGQGIRGGATVVVQAVARAKQLSANQRVVHFLVLENEFNQTTNILVGGWMRIHRDADGDGKYTVGVDPAIDGDKMELPRNILFKKKPDWIGFNPSGYIIFPAAFQEVQAGIFDGEMANASPTAIGDMILEDTAKTVSLCIDLDRSAGKVRRHEFLNQNQ